MKVVGDGSDSRYRKFPLLHPILSELFSESFLPYICRGQGVYLTGHPLGTIASCTNRLETRPDGTSVTGDGTGNKTAFPRVPDALSAAHALHLIQNKVAFRGCMAFDQLSIPETIAVNLALSLEVLHPILATSMACLSRENPKEAGSCHGTTLARNDSQPAKMGRKWG